jgi:hypothetical protein
MHTRICLACCMRASIYTGSGHTATRHMAGVGGECRLSAGRASSETTQLFKSCGGSLPCTFSFSLLLLSSLCALLPCFIGRRLVPWHAFGVTKRGHAFSVTKRGHGTRSTTRTQAFLAGCNEILPHNACVVKFHYTQPKSLLCVLACFCASAIRS